MFRVKLELELWSAPPPWQGLHVKIHEHQGRQGGVLAYKYCYPIIYYSPLMFKFFQGNLYLLHEHGQLHCCFVTLQTWGGGKLSLCLSQNFPLQHMMKLYVNSYFVLIDSCNLIWSRNYQGGMQQIFVQLEWKIAKMKIAFLGYLEAFQRDFS